MKKFFVTTFLILFAVSFYAQPPQGGRRGGRPEGAPPGGMRQSFSEGETKPILEEFPTIPNLTLEQREKVGSILTKEQQDITKQIKKKREFEQDRIEYSTERNIEKDLQKIDGKITEIKDKSNKKIKKVLSDEQYSVFLDKRDMFKFRPQRGKKMAADKENMRNFENRRASENDRSEMDFGSDY